ncbi:MAG: HEAT repeat domain-containing protein [Methanoregula sp.]|jgi:HEAT repeat protein|nr:HEAT repeat domain-containing protein [Methanoregula sp.]
MHPDKNTPFGIRRADIDRETERLVWALDDSKDERRREAIYALAEMDTDALPCILHAFADPGKKDLMDSAGEVLIQWHDTVYSLLAEYFENTDTDTRAAAAGALGYLGKTAGPYLVTALSDPTREVKYRAALSLAQIGWTFSADQVREQVVCAVVRGEPKDLIRVKKSAVPFLIELLKDEDYRVKVGAIKGLGEIKSVKSLPRLAPLFRNDEMEVRTAVVEALGKIGNEKAIPLLIHALGDSTPYVRIEAVWSLEKLGWTPQNNQQMVRFLIAKEQWGKLSMIEAKAIPALVPALLDESPNIRNNVTGILLEKGTSAVPALLQAQQSDNELLRMAATDVLAKIEKSPGNRVPSPFLKGIGDDSWLLSDEAIPEDQMLAVTSDEPGEEPKKNETEPPDARVKRLSAILSDPDPALRTVAVEELRATGLLAFNPLNEALKDPDAGVRSAAAESLGAIKSVRALQPLIHLLRTDPEKQVRIASARALGVIRDTYAIPPLADRFYDPDVEVRAAAAYALGHIGGPALPIVHSMTRDRDSRGRAAAYLSLGVMRDPGVVKFIVHGFTDQDPVVRDHAAHALDAFAQTGPERFLEVIPGLLLSGSAAERGAILDTLAKMKNEEVLWIAYTVREDPDPVVQKKAVNLILMREPGFRPGLPQGTLQPEDERTLRALVEQLSDADPQNRKKAEDHLRRNGPAGIPVLISALRDSSPAVCEIITDIIASMQDNVMNDLIDAIHDESRAVRKAAVTCLGKIYQVRAVYAIGWVLYGEKEPPIRKIAAESLGRSGNKSGIPPLVHSLADMPEVSRAAIDALGKLGCEEACDALVAFLETAHDDAIPCVAQALASCGERTRDTLTRSLMKKSPAFRLNITRVLDILSWQPEDLPGQIQYLVAKGEWDKISALGLPALECLIASFDDEVPKNRFEVARIIGHLGEPARIPLARVLSDKRPHVREGAVLALGYLGKSSEKNIVNLLKDPVATVRYAAAQSLDRIKWVPKGEGSAALYDVARREWTDVAEHKKSAVPALVWVLGDQDFDVQSGAIRTLGTLEDIRAVPYLILLAKKSEDIRIVKAVVSALGQLACPAVQQFLLTSLAHPVFAIRTQAAFSLEKAGWTPKDTDEKVRFFIALQKPGTLAQMGPEIIPLLLRALDDDQVLGRLVITEALISMGEPAIAGLAEILTGDDIQLQDAARNVLALIKKREQPQNGQNGYNKNLVSGNAGTELSEDAKNSLARIRKSLAGADDCAKINAVALLERLGQHSAADLISLARENNAEVKVAALRALGRIKSKNALPVLIPLLADPSPELRRTVTESLGNIRDASAIPHLIRCFLDQSAAVRSSAIRALSGMGNFALRPVLEATDDKEPQIRSAALETLGKFPDPVVLHPLVKGLADPEAGVRLTAAKVLGSLVKRPDSPVIEILTKIHMEGDFLTRLASLDALAVTDDHRALDLLDLLTHDENEQIRNKAQELILRKLNGAQEKLLTRENAGIPDEQDIYRCIQDLEDKNQDVRKRADDTLRGFGEAAVIPLLTAYPLSGPEVQEVILLILEGMARSIAGELERALEHDEVLVRKSAAHILWKIPDPRSVQILGHGLYAASDPKTRQVIAQSLGLLGDRRGTKALIDVLGDPSRDVIIAAIRSLGMLGDELAIRPLIRQLKNSDEDIVLAATGGLRHIGEQARPDLVSVLCNGDHACKAIAAEILEDLNCVPLDPVERAYFLIGKERWYDFEEIGDPALGPLIGTLNDANVHIRLGAVTAIAKIGGAGAIRPLIAALNDPSPIVRHRAENSLVNIGTPIVEPLLTARDLGDIQFPSTARHILHKIEKIQQDPPPEIHSEPETEENVENTRLPDE